MAQLALQDVLPLFQGRLNLGPRFEEPETRTRLAHTIISIEQASGLVGYRNSLEASMEMLKEIWPPNYTWLTGEHHYENMKFALMALKSKSKE
jgi:hypothetical protein